MKKIFIGLFVLFSLMFSANVFAAETINISSKGPVLSSVGVSDYKIVSQENNKINIFFNLLNYNRVQSGVKYSIKLIKETDKGQFVVDEKVYDESLTLAENTILKREIIYIAPANLDGEYSILLTSRNEEGLIFSLGFVGKVKLVRSVKGIEILPETCDLSIPGEKKSYRKYSLTEGVDISPTETLQLNCSALNSDTSPISVTPSFETRYRTSYGEIVPQNNVENNPISFNAGEKKDISILLPKALKPQAYDVKVSLKYNNKTSNTIVAHYVIQGVSASIQNLSLDKDYYKKGDTANIFFAWSASADSFPNSRLGKSSVIPEIFLKGKVTNRMGLSCTEPISQLLSTLHNTLKNDIPISITRDCTNPKISISLVDKDGNVLDQKTFDVKTTTKESKQDYKILIISIALVLISIFMILYLRKKKNKNSNSQINIPVAMFIIFLSIVTVGINYPLFKTEALIQAVMSINGSGGGGGGGGTTVTSTGTPTGTPPAGLTFTATANHALYDPSENVSITTAMSYVACTNSTRDLVATGYIKGINGVTYTGTTATLFNSRIVGSGTTHATSDTIYSNAVLAAPSVAGDKYALQVEIKGYVPVTYNLSDVITTTDEFGTTYSTDIVRTSMVSLSDFKSMVIEYMSTVYPSFTGTSVINSINNATDVSAISTIVFTQTGQVTASVSGGNLDFTRNYEFKPLGIVGVDAYVSASATGADLKSATINKGTSAYVKWNSTVATQCTCTCLDINNNAINCGDKTGVNATSCGTGAGLTTIRSTPYPITGITQTTKFKVSCPPY